MKKPTKIIISIVVAAGLFYGGFAYGQSISGGSQTASSAYGGARATRTGSTTSTAGGGFGGSMVTSGTVVSSDSSSVTIALKSGSVVAFYSTSTPITMTTSGTPNDITDGANITVIGTANSDGSVTANSIQLRQPQTSAQ